MPERGKKHYLVTVLTGPNAGAQVPVGKGTTRIGTEDGADIQLDTLAAGRVALGFSRNQVRIRPTSVAVRDSGGRTCPAGRTTLLSLPTAVFLDDQTQIHLCRTTPARPPMAAFGTGFGLAALVFGMATAGALTGPDSAAVPPQADRHLTAGPGLPRAQPAITADAAADALRAKADELGLEGLSVASDGEAVRVTGSYGLEQSGAWHSLRRLHDDRFGGRIALLADVTESDLSPPFAIASVWLGDAPEIITQDGAALKPGETSAEGWQVDAILPDKVRLTRASQTIEIAF